MKGDNETFIVTNYNSFDGENLLREFLYCVRDRKKSVPGKNIYSAFAAEPPTHKSLKKA
jgi:hypothetical protein